jgi:predicted nucleotidyltransferase
VLYNVSDWEFRDSPWVIYAAMCGNLGFTWPINTVKGQACGRTQSVFLEHGKMVHRGAPQNTTISAITVLSEFNMPNEAYETEYGTRIERLRRKLATEPSAKDRFGIRWDMCKQGKSPICGKCPRVSVFENPVARHKLPVGVFEGPYDTIHWCREVNGFMTIERRFVGTELKRIEDQEYSDVLQKIDRFKKSVVDHYRPEKVILFGSYAYGCPGDNSDVDLLVILPGNGDVSNRSFEIRQKLDHHFPMDLICKSSDQIKRGLRDGDPFIREMVENGKVLYEATGQ